MILASKWNLVTLEESLILSLHLVDDDMSDDAWAVSDDVSMPWFLMVTIGNADVQEMGHCWPQSWPYPPPYLLRVRSIQRTS